MVTKISIHFRYETEHGNKKNIKKTTLCLLFPARLRHKAICTLSRWQYNMIKELAIWEQRRYDIQDGLLMICAVATTGRCHLGYFLTSYTSSVLQSRCGRCMSK